MDGGIYIVELKNSFQFGLISVYFLNQGGEVFSIVEFNHSRVELVVDVRWLRYSRGIGNQEKGEKNDQARHIKESGRRGCLWFCRGKNEFIMRQSPSISQV